MLDKNKRLQTYQNVYLKDYDFEKVMVWARQKYIIELIEKEKRATIVEVSCGKEQLFNKVKHLKTIQQWVIVEPSEVFFSDAKTIADNDARVVAYNAFFEDFVTQNEISGVDLCLCSGLLNEIENPVEILLAAKRIVNPNGLIHVNVPNAFSLHRQLAKEMGLIQTVFEMSDRNKELLQFHIFDRNSLFELISSVPLEVVEEGGYFIKPFTHKQMVDVVSVLGEDILEGLWHLGRKYPELASEIYMNARLKND